MGMPCPTQYCKANYREDGTGNEAGLTAYFALLVPSLIR